MTQQQSDWDNYLEERWPTHYIGTVQGACWMPTYQFFMTKEGQPQYRQEREESMLLVLPMKLETCFEPEGYSGPDPREFYSAGKESEWPTDGVRVLTARKMNPNAKLAHLMERLKGTALGQELQRRAPTWRDASIWDGLRLEVRHEKVELGQFTMDIAVPGLASVPVPSAGPPTPVAVQGAGKAPQGSGATVPPPPPTAGGSAPPHGPYAFVDGEIEVPVPMSVMEQLADETKGLPDRDAVLAHLNRLDGPYRRNSPLMIWAFQSPNGQGFWKLLAELQQAGAGQ